MESVKIGCMLLALCYGPLSGMTESGGRLTFVTLMSGSQGELPGGGAERTEPPGLHADGYHPREEQ